MKRVLSILFFLLFAHSAFAQTYNGIPERFFALLTQGKANESIDYIFSTNPWLNKNADQIGNVKGELVKLNNLMGKYTFHELLAEEKSGTRYVHLVYLVGYERQPMRFELRLYRPATEWRLQGFSFDDKLVDDIGRAVNSHISK